MEPRGIRLGFNDFGIGFKDVLPFPVSEPSLEVKTSPFQNKSI